MHTYVFALCFALGSTSLMAANFNFDESKKGPFETLTIGDAKFSVKKGQAKIIDHKKLKQSLHLNGGEDNTVVLNLGEVKKRAFLNINVERWTSNAPFEFTVDALVNGQWVEFHKLDNKTGTGMKSYKIDLKNTFTDSLRFRVTAPEGKGAIVDNIKVEESTPMIFKGFGGARSTTAPLLNDGKGSESFSVGINASGSENAVAVKELSLFLKGANQIDKIQLFSDKTFLRDIDVKEGDFTVTMDQPIKAGSKSLRIVTVPKSTAEVGSSVEVELKKLSVGDKSKSYSDVKSVQRIAAHLCWSNYTMEDSTFVKGFRIPALVTSKKGTLIATYDIRYNHHGDLPADIDVGMSRSFDGGNTWHPVKNIIDLGGHEAKDGVGDPSLLVDDKTGRIWCAYLWGSGGNSLRTSQPGMELGKSGQFCISYSDDDGDTWSETRNITQEVAAGKDWRMYFNGPGNGITMRDGTLVFPSQYWDVSGASIGTPHASIIYSKDNGKTWKSGTAAMPFTSEAQVVELNDGSLMLNSRYEYRRNGERNKAHDGARAVHITKDFGKTWTEHVSSHSGTKALPEPVCQASILRVASTKDGDAKDILAFVNPNNHRSGHRNNTCLQLSFDEGKTWTHKTQIYPGGSYGYSSISMVDKETIGILYETAGGLIFDKVKIADVPAVNSAQ